MDEPKGLRKIPSYISNISKSISYTVSDVSKDLFPETEKFFATNSEVNTKVFNTIKQSGYHMKNMDKYIKNSSVFKVAEDVVKNSLDDIRTGKLYNKERENYLMGKAMEADGWGFDDFGFDDFDFGDSPSQSGGSSKSNNDDLFMGFDSISKSINTVQAQSTGAIVQGQKASTTIVTNAIYGSMAQINHGLNIISDNIEKIARFNTEVTADYYKQSTKYYEDSAKMMADQYKMMQESFAKMTSGFSNGNQYNRNQSAYDKVYGNGFDIKEYGKAMRQNVSNMTMGMDQLMGSFGGDFLKSQFTGSPLKGILNTMLAIAIPAAFMSNAKNIDKTIGGLFSAINVKVRAMKKSDNGILSFLGDLFGIESNGSAAIDLGSYTKTAIPFDGVTKKAIVEVIPMYLRKILSAVSGQPEVIMDFATGKLKTVQTVRDDHAKDMKYLDRYHMGDLEDTLMGRLDMIKFENQKQLEDLKKAITSSIKSQVDSGQLYNFKKDNDYFDLTTMRGFDLADETTMRQLSMLYKSLDKNTANQIPSMIEKARQNRFENRDRLSNDMVERGHSSVLAWDEIKDSLGGVNKLGSVDKYGKSMFDYLRKVTEQLHGTLDVNIVGNRPPGGGGPKGGRRKSNDPFFDAPLGISDSSNPTPYTSSYRNQYYNDLIPASALDTDNDADIVESLRKANKGEWIDPNKKDESAWKKSDKVKSFKERIDSLKGGFANIFTKPLAIFDKIFKGIDDKVYEMIYGKDDNDGTDPDGKKKGFLKTFKEKLDKKLEGVKKMFDEKLLTPIKNFFFDENDGIFPKMSNAFKQSAFYQMFLDKKQQAKTFLLGTKDGNGIYTGGVFSAFSNQFRDIGAHFSNYITGKGTTLSDGTVLQFNRESIFGSVGMMFSRVNASVGDFLFGNEYERGEDGKFKLKMKGAKRGVMTDVIENFKELGTNVTNSLFGSSDSKDEFSKKFEQEIKIVKEKYPKLAIGGGLGMLGSLFLPGGPILGGFLGSSIAFATASDRFKDFLFGKQVDDGNGGFYREGSKLISRELQEKFKDRKVNIQAGGALGLVGSLFLPGGPILGTMIGSAVGYASKNQAFQEFLFGKTLEDGSIDDSKALFSKKLQENFKKYVPTAVAGAGIGSLGLGMLGIGGPFGIMGGMAIGSAVSMASNSEKVKTFLFGEWDEEKAKREGGVFGKIGTWVNTKVFSPFKDYMKETQMKISNWMVDNVKAPFMTVVEPLKKEFSLMMESTKQLFADSWKSLGDSVGKMFEERVGKPFGEIMEEKVLNPLKGFLSKIFGGIGKAVGSVITAPIKVLTNFSDALRGKHIANGDADYMTDEEIDEYNRLHPKNPIQKFKNKIGGWQKNRKEKAKNGELWHQKLGLGIKTTATEWSNAVMKTTDDIELGVKMAGLGIMMAGGSIKSGIFNAFSRKRKEQAKKATTTTHNKKGMSPVLTVGPNGELIPVSDDSDGPIRIANGGLVGKSFTGRMKSTTAKLDADGVPIASDASTSSGKKGLKAPAQFTGNMNFDAFMRKFNKNSTYIKDIRDEVHGQMDGLGYNMETVANVLVDQFGAPSITAKLAKGMRGNNKRRTFVGRIFGAITKPFELAGKFAFNVVSAPFKLLGKAIGGIASTLNEVLKMMLAIPAQIVKGIAGAIDIVANVIGSIGPAIGKILSGMAGAVGGLIDGLGAVFKGIGKAVGSMVTGLGSMIGKVIKGFGELVASIPKLISVVADMTTAFAKATWGLIKFAGAAIGKAVGGVFDFATGRTKKIIQKNDERYVIIAGGTLDKVKSIENIQNITSVKEVLDMKKGEISVKELHSENVAALLDKPKTGAKVISLANRRKGLGATGEPAAAAIGGVPTNIANSLPNIDPDAPDIVPPGTRMTANTRKLILRKKQTLKSKAKQDKLLGTAANATIEQNTLMKKSGFFKGIGGFFKTIDTLASGLVGLAGMATFLPMIKDIWDWFHGKKNGEGEGAVHTANSIVENSPIEEVFTRVPFTQMRKFGAKALANTMIHNNRFAGKLVQAGSKGVGKAILNPKGFIADGVMTGAEKAVTGVKSVGSKVVNSNAVSTAAKTIADSSPAKFIAGLKKLITSKEVIAVVGSDVAEKVAKEAAEQIVEKSAKGLGKAALRQAAGALTGGLVTAVLFAADIVTGMAEAKRIFDLPSDAKVGLKLRIAAGFGKAISNATLVTSFFDPGWIGKIIYNLIADEEEENKLKSSQDEMKRLTEEYNKANGTNLTVTEYSNKVNRSVVQKFITDPLKNLSGGIANFAGGVSETFSKLFSASFLPKFDGLSATVNKILDRMTYGNTTGTRFTSGTSAYSGYSSLTSNAYIPYYGRGEARSAFSVDPKNDGSKDSMNAMSMTQIAANAFYSQKDDRWKSTPFSVSGDKKIETLGTSGCAPTVAAMLGTMSSGKAIYPNDMTIMNMAKMNKLPNGGTSATFFEKYAKDVLKSQIEVMNGPTSTPEREKFAGNVIEKGFPTVLLGGGDPKFHSMYNSLNSPWKPLSPHFVLATGVRRIDGKNDRIIIQDPLSNTPNKEYSLRDTLRFAKMAMINKFKPKGRASITKTASSTATTGGNASEAYTNYDGTEVVPTGDPMKDLGFFEAIGLIGKATSAYFESMIKGEPYTKSLAELMGIETDQSNELSEMGVFQGDEWVMGDLGIHDWFGLKLTAMAKALGKKMNITSGFRTKEEQQALWDKAKKDYPGLTDDQLAWKVARPGNSRHEYGLAVDLADDFWKNIKKSEFEKYGLTKPLSHEPWHIEPKELVGLSRDQVKSKYGLPGRLGFAGLTSNQFIERIAPGAAKTYKQYKVLPSLTIAQAILESGWGKKAIGNNLFGIKASNDWIARGGMTRSTGTKEWRNGQFESTTGLFRDYASIDDSIIDHAKVLSNSRYDTVRRAKTLAEAAYAVSQAGYATDPNYPKLLIQLARENNLSRFDDESVISQYAGKGDGSTSSRYNVYAGYGDGPSSVLPKSISSKSKKYATKVNLLSKENSKVTSRYDRYLTASAIKEKTGGNISIAAIVALLERIAINTANTVQAVVDSDKNIEVTVVEKQSDQTSSNTNVNVNNVSSNAFVKLANSGTSQGKTASKPNTNIKKIAAGHL